MAEKFMDVKKSMSLALTRSNHQLVKAQRLVNQSPWMSQLCCMAVHRDGSTWSKVRLQCEPAVQKKSQNQK